MQAQKFMTEQEVFTFGKYKNKTFEYVLWADPHYLDRARNKKLIVLNELMLLKTQRLCSLFSNPYEREISAGWDGSEDN